MPNVAVPNCPALPDWNRQRPYLTGQYLMESLEVEEPSTSRQQALESFSPAVQELVGKLPLLPAPCCDALCCDALCYAMMPGSMLCCAELRRAVLCCAVLCCAVLCCAVLCHASFPDRCSKPCKLQGLPLGRDQHCQSPVQSWTALMHSYMTSLATAMMQCWRTCCGVSWALKASTSRPTGHARQKVESALS